MKALTQFSKIILTLLVGLILTSQLVAQVEKGTNGRNVNVVEYDGRTNEAPGAFKQTDSNTWVEVKNNKAEYHGHFTELTRDDWSVYLKKSDGLYIQLDLHTKKIKINGGNYYEINKAINQVNGRNANLVEYNATSSELAGSFKQTGSFTWAEFKTGKNAPHSTFKETNRDAWSIYLTKSDGLKLTLNLHTKKVNINGSEYYSISKASNKPNGRIATLVEYIANSVHKGGTFKQIGPKTWAEYKRGKTGAQSTFTENNRDDWSIYLTKSDGLRIQIDLWTNKIKLSGADYYDIIAASCIPAKAETSNLNLIHFPGTGKSVTVTELRKELSQKGFTLVQSQELQPNQCALVYPNADADDISAEFGIMMCAHQFGDNVTLDQAVIHGGCDAANPMTQGVGAKCEVGVLKQNLKVKFDGGETNFSVKGPSAEVCSAASSEFICFNAGATLASTSFEVKDDRGNGVGIGVSAGVGYGVDGSYEDGVISGSLDLKIIAGASITFSVNTDDIVSGASTIGETGYVLVKDEVVAASQSTVDYFEKNFTRDVVVVGEDAIGFAEDAGKEIGKGGEKVIEVGEETIKEISSWFD